MSEIIARDTDHDKQARRKHKGGRADVDWRAVRALSCEKRKKGLEKVSGGKGRNKGRRRWVWRRRRLRHERARNWLNFVDHKMEFDWSLLYGSFSV